MTPNVVDQTEGHNWALYNGDSTEVLQGIPTDSIDLSVYSPPFSHLYTYSASERDLGNSADDDTFFQHYAYIIGEMLRVTKPGRLSAVHVAQIPLQKARDGVIGLKDFRGDVIRAHQAAGWIYHGEAVVQKSAQSQAIRTKSKALLFIQVHKDSSWSRPALADYILLFRKPGLNVVPIQPDITNDQWIEWAHPIWTVDTTFVDKELAGGSVFDLAPGTPLLWFGIRESDTLNIAEARSDDDERHIAPLQLEAIRRCIQLWSNPGETVLSCFAGIGSEIYQAIKLGRKGVGVELKSEYFKVAVKNCRQAETLMRVPTLMDRLTEVQSAS